MNHEFDFALPFAYLILVSSRLDVIVPIVKKHGVAFVPEAFYYAVCYAVSLVLLFLSLWLPFHSHIFLAHHLCYRLITVSLVALKLPDIVRGVAKHIKPKARQ